MGDSEVLLKPIRIYPDPFRGGDNIIVLCECLDPKMQPLPTNTRAAACETFNKNLGEKPWFGIEQEYTLFERDGRTPLGWPKGGFPPPQGPYYCSAGTDVSFGRSVMEAHYEACLYANVTIAGINAEVMPGQWEYQIGPCEGIQSGDDMWMSRYLMFRVCERLGVNVTFDKARERRLERRGLPHELLDGPDARGGRLRRDHQGHREAGGEARGAHQGLRRGQRAPPHRRARDGAHHQVLLRRGESRRLGPDPARLGGGEEGLLRGSPSCQQHGPARGHLQDLPDNVPLSARVGDAGRTRGSFSSALSETSQTKK